MSTDFFDLFLKKNIFIVMDGYHKGMITKHKKNCSFEYVFKNKNGKYQKMLILKSEYKNIKSIYRESIFTFLKYKIAYILIKGR